MNLTTEERATLVSLELRKARETFEEIEILTSANKWSGAANRLYYSVFHAISALLIHDGFSVNTHHLYNQLQTMREESDYNCAYDIEPEELQMRIAPAKRLIEDVERIVTPIQ